MICIINLYYEDVLVIYYNAGVWQKCATFLNFFVGKNNGIRTIFKNV